ncbi:hypothetical protein [Nocardioides sp.]|uniref:hypothetical protein n=1 Tax=Nocardioides sp. TaxID=35761 RepID=UPI002BE8EB09|nr:hypothetical protein [Nocardioides sp.]HXH76933.1 hypothetical protein [Nocardioides sp.]
MTDFETRLRDSLAERAEEAPAPTGLAMGARGRLHRRRAAIAKVAAGVAVGTVVVAAVPLGMALVEGVDAPSRPRQVAPNTPFIVPDNSPEIEPARDTRREVEWSDITFKVPSEWKAGATTAWCAKARKPGGVVPRIDMPDQERPTTSCTPTSGYGVRVSPAADFEPDRNSREVWEYDAEGATTEEYPDGAWVSYWYDDDWVVTTATPDPGLTSRITRSVRGMGADVNGCAMILDESDLLEKVGAPGVGASLCRYAWDGELEDSQRLTEREADLALAALGAAPEIAGDDGCVQERGWVVALTPAGQPSYLARYGTSGLGSCQDGVESGAPEQLVSRDRLELTTEVALALDLGDLSID